MYSFNIILTNFCNAHCSHCYMKTNENPKTLSFEKIDLLVDKLPINTKASPPAINIDICEKPLVITSIQQYKNPPIKKSVIYLITLFLVIKSTSAFIVYANSSVFNL